MDELISREAAIKKILFCENHDMEHDFEFNEGLIAAMKAIFEHPTVEIIQCKDCKYGEQDDEGWWYCNDLGCQMGDDDGSGFCSDAERRE